MAPLVQSPSEEYRALVDKAYNKFARLREFPPYGRNKWDFYFHKAFQVYSKLWKFQQENRQKLVEMGLKRWEIGEIASRIGQLYYNYYLRTSDAKFLSESFIFYEAIMSREYFKDNDKDVSLANKQLRYTARFIVICLLLNRREMVQLLVRQLRTLVEEYSRTFQGNDSKEWKLVVQEIVRFMKADTGCDTSRPLRYSVLLDPHPSLLPTIGKLEGKKPLRLEDAVLASYYHNEVKFSELTLDTFRMLQALEWEPSGALYRTRSGETSSRTPGASGRIGAVEEIADPSLPPNPHKYILYRPTVQQLLLVLATACEELSSLDSIVLLYISASGKPSRSISASASSASMTAGLSCGNEIVSLTPTLSMNRLILNQIPAETNSHGEGQVEVEQSDLSAASMPDSPVKQSNHVVPISQIEPSGSSLPGLWLGSKRSTGYNFLYPSDILPFTRRPLFIIIDSDNSSIFETISGEERGEPAVLFLSPSMQPVDERGVGTTPSSPSSSSGNLFTFFLTAPLLAFCRVVGVNITNLQKGVYDQTEKLLATLLAEWGNTLASSTSISLVWARVLGDPFLRQLMFRFIFCRACFALHGRYGDKPEYAPSCCPPLPDEVLPGSKMVEAVVVLLSSSLGVANQFDFSQSAMRKSVLQSNGSFQPGYYGAPKSDCTGEISAMDELSEESFGE